LRLEPNWNSGDGLKPGFASAEHSRNTPRP
jgi:hypothetical protein